MQFALSWVVHEGTRVVVAGQLALCHPVQLPFVTTTNATRIDHVSIAIAFAITDLLA